MGIGTSKLHVRGCDQEFFFNPETTMGQFSEPATGDSVRVLSTTISPKIPRKDRTDAYMSTRSILERITQKSEHSWAMEGYYCPSGTKTTAPDCGDIIKLAMGTETVNANDVTYSLSSTQALTTASIVRHWDTIFMEALAGAWVEELTLSFAGGQEPKISASGGAMDYAATGYTTTNGALVGAETTVNVAAGGGVNFHDPKSSSVYAQSVITVGSSTDHVVTDRSTDALTITPGIVGAQNDGVAVVPYAPAHTTTGSPIAGITGALTWDSLAFAVTAFSIKIKNQIKALSDHAFVPHTDDILPMFREVTGTVSVRLRQDFIVKLLARQDFGTVAIAVNAGGAAQSGTRVQVAVPYAELEYSDVTVPEAEEATVDFNFKALGSSGNDECTILHT